MAPAGCSRYTAMMRRTILALFALAVLGMAGLVALAIREARAEPIVRRATLGLAHWPAGAAPIRVALLSDIHLGGVAMDGARLARIVAQVNALHADLIVLAGDFVNGEDPGAARRVAPGLGVLHRLQAPLGMVAVLGNHDYDTAPDAIALQLRLAGVTVLENAAVRRGPLVIDGAADSSQRRDDIARTVMHNAALGGVPVLVDHSPELIERVPRDIDLLLVGHTHCGQLVLPLVGPPIAFWPRRYRCGIVRDPTLTTVIGAGLGTSRLPLRLGAPPDLWLLTLGPGISRSRP